MTRPSFPEDAACVGYDPDMFTCEPNERRSSVDVNRMRADAARICGGCPVKNECLGAAEAGRTVPRIPGSHKVIDLPFGVLGGLFYNGTRNPPIDVLTYERVRELFARGLSDTDIGKVIGVTGYTVRGMRDRLGLHRKGKRGRLALTFKHGSQAGVDAHRRRGEDPCIECIAGQREEKRQRRLRQKKAA